MFVSKPTKKRNMQKAGSSGEMGTHCGKPAVIAMTKGDSGAMSKLPRKVPSRTMSMSMKKESY